MTNKLPIGWTLKRLGDITERITRKNTINNNNVLTISAEHGFISQDKFFTKIVASKDLSKYILLYKGDFCYNKSYCRGYPYGVFRKLKNYDVGVATSLYIYFKIIEGDSTFFEYLFDVGTLNKQLSIISQEGVRNHGLLNVPIEDFFNMTVPFPPIDEQKRIAEVLSLCDKLIENLNKLIEKKELYKKGVMQRVLSGKVRFEGFTDEWETYKFEDIFIRIAGKKYQINQNEYKEIGKYPVIDQGKKYITAYSDNADKVFNNDNIIVFGDHTRIFKYVDFNFIIGADGVQLLKTNKEFDTKFMYYNLSNQYIPNTGYNRHFKFILDMSFYIPPSIEEQNKIAELLTLIDKDIEILKQLLHLRKLQKKGVMQKLLTGEVRI